MLRWLAAGALACLTLQSAGAAQVSYYQLPAGAYSARCCARLRRRRVVFRPAERRARPFRSENRKSRADSAWPQFRAAWRHRRSRRIGVADRRRTERHRTLRSSDGEARRISAAGAISQCQSEHGVFGKNGTYWFTGQNGVYGRVDPRTGKVDAWAAPKGAGPYGIAATSSGDIWFVSLAGNYLAKIDTASGAATLIDPPSPNAGPRRVWSDSNGILWVSLWNAGAIGRYDPSTKTWKIYPLPKSTAGCYAVYVDDKDRVWVTDWLDNAIQLFDPKTEKFTTFKSDKRSADVRQLNGRPGEVWGGQSGTDRLVVVRE